MELVNIKGIGPKLNEILNKMGIKDVNSLLSYFPKEYENRTLGSLKNKDSFFKGIIASSLTISKPKEKEIVSFDLIVDDVLYKASGFNMSYIEKIYKIGDKVVLSGTLDPKYNNIIIRKLLKESDFKEGIFPIYNIDGIQNGVIAKAIKACLEYYTLKQSIIPSEYYSKYGYKTGKDLIESIHFPKDMNELKESIDCLKYHELLNFALKMEVINENESSLRRNPIRYDLARIKELIESIPFELTADQKRCVNDICLSLESDKPLNMLLEGDTGSGKTICSLIAAFACFTGGYQTLFFAPTEVLCYQHFNTFNKYLNKFNVNVKLLTSSTKAKERLELINELENGKIDILISTHSVLSGDVVFNNLGLVIIDEQHKVGVNQRRTLREKGINPNILYMSATPIPRSLALTFFSNMKLEELRSTRNKGNVKTFIHTYKDYLKILDFIRSEVNEKRQAYFVCPLIEEDKNDELTSVLRVKKDLDEYYKNLRIDILHGKLSDNEKLEVLDKFNKGEIDILVSTTVIEVGIDNKNASSIVVLDSFRFGLSQLHQLRGRVGRGECDGYCFLMVNSLIDKSRLGILEETSDGFKISEADLKYRGSGDFLGLNQSGNMKLKYSNIVADRDILNKAINDSKELVKDNRIKNYYRSLVDSEFFD